MTRWCSLALLCLAGPAVADATTHTVLIEGMAFTPAALVVRAGDVVVWENKDVVPHTVTAKGRFDSGPIAAGNGWRWTARKAGRIEYGCTYHPGMRATVNVE